MTKNGILINRLVNKYFKFYFYSLPESGSQTHSNPGTAFQKQWISLWNSDTVLPLWRSNRPANFAGLRKVCAQRSGIARYRIALHSVTSRSVNSPRTLVPSKRGPCLPKGWFVSTGLRQQPLGYQADEGIPAIHSYPLIRTTFYEVQLNGIRGSSE